MKNLIKLLIVAVMFSLATESFAQTFGVKGGLNLSNILEKDDEDTYSDDYKMNTGFHVGPTAEFPINDMFSFEAGLLLSTKGFKYSEEGDGAEITVNVNMLYVDIPLTAKAYYNIGNAKIYGVFGPYIGMGLSGKYKAKITYQGETETESEDIKWGSGDDDDAKRLDFGLAIGAGVAINSIQVGLSYGLGLANISTENDGGYKMNNRVLGITVGYKFGGK